MSVANAMPLRVDLTVPPVPKRREARPHGGNFNAVPRLETYAPGMRLRSDLLRDGAPAQAAFFVDISAGTVVAEKFSNGGVYATWMVETDGDPELVFTRHKGKSRTVTIPSTPPGAHLPPSVWFGDAVPGSLALHNSTFDQEDKQYDFVLHYLARDGGIPTDLRQPFPGEDVIDVTDIGTSTSCSNSQYP